MDQFVIQDRLQTALDAAEGKPTDKARWESLAHAVITLCSEINENRPNRWGHGPNLL